jgi:hypothetical protein
LKKQNIAEINILFRLEDVLRISFDQGDHKGFFGLRGVSGSIRVNHHQNLTLEQKFCLLSILA